MKETQLAEFFSALGAVHRTARDIRKIYDRDLALEFNPLLNFFRVSENKLSQIIAYFLNPSERHGQGTLFLDIFLKQFGFDEQLGKRICINCEQPTHAGRRLDVYITFPETGFAIGIENKIWAIGQQNQLTDYNQYLDKMHGGNYKLLYWRPYDYHPEEHSMPASERESLQASGHYSELNHMDDTSDLIEAWMRACQADRVRNFLRDLYQFIQHEINSEKFMGQNDLTADFILDSDENFQTALQVHAAIDLACDRLTAQLKPKFQKLAEKLGLTLERFDMLSRSKPYAGFSFGIGQHSALPVSIRFEWDGAWLKQGFAGYVNSDGDHLERQEIFAATFGKERSSPGWPWYQLLEQYKDIHHETYADFRNDKFVAYVEKKVKELLAKIEGFELPR